MTIALEPARYRTPDERPSSGLTLRAIALELVALAEDSVTFPALADRVEIRRDAQTVRLTAILFDDGAISGHYAAAMQDASSKLLERLAGMAAEAKR